MKDLTELQQAVKVFGDKAPVNRETSQRIATKAYRKFKHLLTSEEQTKISIALSHSDIGEGRFEFDREFGIIKQRLTKVVK